MTVDRQKYLERQRRYNTSEKGRERNLRYWHRPGGGLHRRREREIADLDRKINEIITNHPDLLWVLEG